MMCERGFGFGDDQNRDASAIKWFNNELCSCDCKHV